MVGVGDNDVGDGVDEAVEVADGDKRDGVLVSTKSSAPDPVLELAQALTVSHKHSTLRMKKVCLMLICLYNQIKVLEVITDNLLAISDN